MPATHIILRDTVDGRVELTVMRSPGSHAALSQSLIGLMLVALTDCLDMRGIADQLIEGHSISMDTLLPMDIDSVVALRSDGNHFDCACTVCCEDASYPADMGLKA